GVGLILHVRRRDRNPPRLLFRRVIDRIKRAELNLGVVLLQDLGDGRRQRSLAMINVPNRPHIHVRLGAFKFRFRHLLAPCSAGTLARVPLCRSYGTQSYFSVPQGLRPGLNYSALRVLSRWGINHLRLPPHSRNTRRGIAVSQLAPQLKSAVRISHAQLETSRERFRKRGASSRYPEPCNARPATHMPFS